MKGEDFMPVDLTEHIVREPRILSKKEKEILNEEKWKLSRPMRDIMLLQLTTKDLEQRIKFYEKRLQKKDWRYGDREHYEHWISEAREELNSRA